MCKRHCQSGRTTMLDTLGSNSWDMIKSASPPPHVVNMSELMTAVKSGDFDAVVKAFSTVQEDELLHITNYRAPETKETLLFSACVRGHVETVRFLLAVGSSGRGGGQTVQTDLCTAWGAVPLHAAAERCHETVVRLLLENGADTDAQTSYGDTPTHLAAYKGHYAVVKCLVEAGAKLTVRNSKGKTALDDAAGARHTRIVQYLTAVMYPDIYGRVKTSETGKVSDQDTSDLMKNRPLGEPTRPRHHSTRDRSNTWHYSCLHHDQDRNSHQSSRQASTVSSQLETGTETETEASLNNLSQIPEWDAATRTSTTTTSSSRPHGESGAEAGRRDYYFGNRRASDSRVWHLEKMVERLQLGLRLSQEELGRTRVELRRARDAAVQSPPSCKGDRSPCPCNGKSRLVLNLRDVGHKMH